MQAPAAPGSDAQDVPGPEVLREAARWFVLLSSGEATETDRQRWRAWRAADARHEAAWRRAEAVTSFFAQLPSGQADLAVAALDRGAARRSGRRRTLGGLAGLFICGLSAWHGWAAWRRSDLSADAWTAVGELRDLTLPDGSRLRLDTDTAIELVFSARERVVRLRRGRVLVTTAKPPGMDRPPPFLVETAEGRVQALGTRFVVRQEAQRTYVAVMEARVAIHAAAGGRGHAIELAAGDAVRFDREGHAQQHAARPGDDAWARGMLVADDMALGDFVAELARYRVAPLACEPEARALRISGTYPLTDTDQALAAVMRALPVRVVPQRAGDPMGGQAIRRAR